MARPPKLGDDSPSDSTDSTATASIASPSLSSSAADSSAADGPVPPLSGEIGPPADPAQAAASTEILEDPAPASTTATEPGALEAGSDESASVEPGSDESGSQDDADAGPTRFEDMELSPTLREAITALGWDNPTPVQSRTFGPVCRGKDVLVQSQTGSGKTGAFCLPWLAARFQDAPASQTGVQLLVLTPTRELAKQVCDQLVSLGRQSNVTPLPVYGGTAMQPQLAALKRGVHAVVGTPGRILDHIRRRTLKLDNVQMVVLDEADEMLSMGFLEDIHAILEACPRERQTTLFSATVPPDIERIARRYMHDPISIMLSGDQVAAAEINHAYYTVGGALRTRDLLDIIALEEPANALIFCNTREETNVVANVLRREGYSAEALSSDLTQTAREKVLGWMRAGRLRFLVATDVASRGIDISHIGHVINYTFPENAESYVHRTGRTGRAGRPGQAISLIAPQELGNFYYLKLQYPTISFEERRLPSKDELEAQRLETKLDHVSALFPDLVSPEWTLLARHLMKDPRGEQVVAYLLSEGVSRQAAARAQAQPEDEERLEARERRGRRGDFDRDRDRDRDRDGERGRGRGRHRDRDPELIAQGDEPGEGLVEEREDRRRRRRRRRRDPSDADERLAEDPAASTAEADTETSDTESSGQSPAQASTQAQGEPEGAGGDGRRRRRRRRRRRSATEAEGGEAQTEAAVAETIAMADADVEPEAHVAAPLPHPEATEPAGTETPAQPEQDLPELPEEGAELTVDAAALAAEALPEADAGEDVVEPRRRRRRRRRRRGKGGDGAHRAAGEDEPARSESATETSENDRAASGSGDDVEGKKRRRRRRRGRRKSTTPPEQATQAHVSQDQIIIDIDEEELEVVRGQFGEIDELDDLTLKGRRRGVIDALQDEVELEDMSARDDREAKGNEAESEDEDEDEGESSAADADAESDDTAAAEGDGGLDEREHKKRKRRRRRRKKAKEEAPTPELTAPPHKDFWEVWAAKFSYTQFEDEVYLGKDAAEAEAAAEEAASLRELPGHPLEGADEDDSEFVEVMLSVGRKHGKKSAHIRELLSSEFKLAGKSVRNLTVTEEHTRFRVSRTNYERLAQGMLGYVFDSVELQLTLTEPVSTGDGVASAATGEDAGETEEASAAEAVEVEAAPVPVSDETSSSDVAQPS